MRGRISIIIPARNEENNIVDLVKRIDTALVQSRVTYEIILIDDHSTDSTYITAKTLAKTYPISVYRKKAKPGKAQSLIEGFAHAKYNVLCMIDADLQYPPEAIVEMIAQINKGADIVVAKRKNKKTSFIRNFLSNGYLYFFGKVLHNFECNVQSGMKVFKKEIIQRISLNPSPWTFDLEFLIKARNAGYKIANVDILFSERTAGKTQIRLVNADLHMVGHACGIHF